MKNKDIMLIAGYPYLTESTFLALNKIFKNRVYIYDPLDYSLARTFAKYRYPEDIKSSYISCSYKPIWTRYIKIPWLISIFLSAQKWSKAIICDVKKYNPTAIILITDIFPSAKIIDEEITGTNQYLIQPCLIDAWKREDKHLFKRKFLNKLLGLNFFHMQQYWGLEGKNNKLCLYDSEIKDFFEFKRNDIQLIESPMKRFFELKILKNRTYKKKSEKLKVGIYPVDYRSIYGEEYQIEFEKKYKKLCLSLSNEDLYVKIHPHDDESYWKKLLPKNIKIIKNEHKEELYLNTDIHISTYSYSSIEAFYGGSYAINFQPKIVEMQGRMEEIFLNNCSHYTEEIKEILEKIELFKVMSSEQKKIFISEEMKKTKNNNFLPMEEVIN